MTLTTKDEGKYQSHPPAALHFLEKLFDFCKFGAFQALLAEQSLPHDIGRDTAGTGTPLA